MERSLSCEKRKVQKTSLARGEHGRVSEEMISTPSQLLQLRQEIDLVDEQILNAINIRADLVLKIFKIKDEHELPFRDPKRESELIQNLLKKNAGPIQNSSLIRIYETLIEVLVAEALQSSSQDS